MTIDLLVTYLSSKQLITGVKSPKLYYSLVGRFPFHLVIIVLVWFVCTFVSEVVKLLWNYRQTYVNDDFGACLRLQNSKQQQPITAVESVTWSSSLQLQWHYNLVHCISNLLTAWDKDKKCIDSSISNCFIIRAVYPTLLYNKSNSLKFANSVRSS